MVETFETAEDERPTVLARGVVVGGAALLAVGVFIAGVTIAYQMGLETGRSGTTPIIRADDGPVKFRPQDPGGMKIPNRDKEIYRRMAKGAGKPPPARLLPPQEKPIENLLLTIDPSLAGGKPKPAARPRTADSARPPSAPPRTAGALSGENGGATPVPRPKPTRLAAVADGAGAPPVKPGVETYVAQLAATRSRENVANALNKIRKDNPALLEGVRPNIVAIDLGASRGIWYRLRMGPFETKEAARAYCGKAAARKVTCLVVRR